jgi:hypothetical protein
VDPGDANATTATDYVTPANVIAYGGNVTLGTVQVFATASDAAGRVPDLRNAINTPASKNLNAGLIRWSPPPPAPPITSTPTRMRRTTLAAMPRSASGRGADANDSSKSAYKVYASADAYLSASRT